MTEETTGQDTQEQAPATPETVAPETDTAAPAETPAPAADDAAAPLEKAVDEAIAEKPTPKGFFSLEVDWREGTTEGEQEAALPFIKEFSAALAESTEDHFPLCITKLAIKRDN